MASAASHTAAPEQPITAAHRSITAAAAAGALGGLMLLTASLWLLHGSQPPWPEVPALP